ncbi:MAG TPA: hypothetical protein VI564_00680 [Candidatus Nanoarchaeia archaeon]|nr:hypothetical protein [Candidatus Nanoarchaeia archaeon]
MNKKTFALLFLLALFIYGCQEISQGDAEKKALDFVNKNVRFYAKEQNETSVLQEYKVESLSSYKENSQWTVLMHISSEYQNETKKNDLTVKLNGKGDVTEFNGKKISKK